MEQAEPAPARGNGRILNLQVVRALAATAVIVFHSVGSLRDYGFPSGGAYRLFGWGYQGLDIFFLISGFVMILTETRRNRSAGAFLGDRLSRIAPIYWLLTLFLFVLLAAIPGLFRVMSADPLVLLRSLTFTSFLFGRLPPLIFVGWTLEYEMLLYLVFAASLFLSGWTRRLVFGTAVVIVIAPAVPDWPILFEFLIGEACALFYLSGRRIKGTGALLALGVAGMVLPPLFAQEAIADNTTRLLVYGVSGTFMLLSVAQMRQSANGFLVRIGDASYSIYLVQVFTIPVCAKLFALTWPSAPASIVLLFDVVGTIVAGMLLYLVVEKPAGSLIKRLRTGWAQASPTATPKAAAQES